MPQGALEAQATNKRSMIKIVVSTILAVHGVVLGGLLFLGCKEEAPDTQSEYAENALATREPIESEEDVDPFGNIGLPDLPDTSQDIVFPGETLGTGRTGDLPPIPPGFPGETNSGFVPGDSGSADVTEGDLQRGGLTPPDMDPPVPERTVMKQYIVVPGDNYYKIAAKHGLKASDISRANPGVNPRKLQVGDALNLPPDVPPVTPSVPESGGQKSSSVGGTTHTVKSGDNLTRISKRYGVSIKAIQEANNITGSRINVGQKLAIPVPTN